MEDNKRNAPPRQNGSYRYGQSGAPQQPQRQTRPPQQQQQQYENPWRMPQQPMGSGRVTPPLPPRTQQMTMDRPQQRPQQNPQQRPQQQRPQQRQEQRPLAHPGVSPVRRAAPVSKRPLSNNRPGYSYNNYGLRPRHRRPTPFLLILIVFAIILLIVVFTSKGFRNLIDSISRDEPDTEAESGDNTGEPAESTNGETDAASGTEEPIETEDPETMPPPEDDLFLIFIDPGHGFGDGGTSSELLGDVLEKDITIDIAKEVTRILSESGYNVMLTHDGNEFPKAPNDDGDALFYIDERVSYVNSKGADLFVSIHCDSFPDNDSVRGTRIYYCSGNKYSEESAKLVDGLKAAIDSQYADYKEVLTYGRDIASSYYVTAYTECPSALIEVGFVSNEKDAEKMLDEEWKHDMAYLIASAIADHVNAEDDPTESE